MASNGNAPNKICLYPDQLTSLLSIARVLPSRKYAVLLALLHYLQGDSLKSTATRKQMIEQTGLKDRTIYTYIKEFEACGLVKAWRGPFETKQKFYRVNLPAPDRVFEFYGEAEKEVKSSWKSRSKSNQVVQSISYSSPALSVLDGEDVILKVESPDGDGYSDESLHDSSSSEDLPLPSDDLQTPPDASPAPKDFPVTSLQGSSSDLLSSKERSHESMTESIENAYHQSESFFDDPRLDLLVAQIEEGRKDGTLLFRWLKSQNLLTYWPPTDSYRVEKEMLRRAVKTLDDLNAILTAPVKPEYQWFVEEFLQVCRDNGYDVTDTSQTLALEINMFLDSMLKPESRHGKSLWTASSLKVQLKMMIQEWKKLPTWKQLRLPIEPPSVPSLEFFVTNRVVWEAARERCIEEQETKMLNFLEQFETGRSAMVGSPQG